VAIHPMAKAVCSGLLHFIRNDVIHLQSEEIKSFPFKDDEQALRKSKIPAHVFKGLMCGYTFIRAKPYKG
jgi:hypothetical protein